MMWVVAACQAAGRADNSSSPRQGFRIRGSRKAGGPVRERLVWVVS